MGLPAFSLGSAPDLDAESQRGIVRRAMHIGLWVWPSFALLDAWMCFVAYPGAPFGLFVIYRLAVELSFVAVYRASARPGIPVGHLTYGRTSASAWRRSASPSGRCISAASSVRTCTASRSPPAREAASHRSR